MANVIEEAKSGRAACRTCKKPIAKGELRFGEEAPNAFGDQPSLRWHHLACAAAKLPAELKATLETHGDVPNRAELGDLVRNQLAEARRLGVTIELGVDVDVAEVQRRGADRVIVATGAQVARPWWAPADATHVVDVRDVLSEAVEPTGDVVVIDEIGFHHATSVAELLADRGCAVEVITPGMVVGQDLGITLDLEQWWIRAMAKGIVQSI